MMFLHLSTSRALTLLLDLLGRGVLFGYGLCHLEKSLVLSPKSLSGNVVVVMMVVVVRVTVS